jgi:ribokinase
LAAEQGVSLLPIAQVDAIDTSGAGDVTVGILAAGLAKGMTLEQALKLALSAASLSVTRQGTSLSFPSGDELAALEFTVVGSH